VPILVVAPRCQPCSEGKRASCRLGKTKADTRVHCAQRVINVPDRSGYEVAQSLREHAGRDLRLIALTSSRLRSY
jgi:hypothetical protein